MRCLNSNLDLPLSVLRLVLFATHSYLNLKIVPSIVHPEASLLALLHQSSPSNNSKVVPIPIISDSSHFKDLSDSTVAFIFKNWSFRYFVFCFDTSIVVGENLGETLAPIAVLSMRNTCVTSIVPVVTDAGQDPLYLVWPND